MPFLIPFFHFLCILFLSILLPKNHSTGEKWQEKNRKGYWERTYIFQRNQFHDCLIGRSESGWVVVVDNIVFIILFVGNLKHKKGTRKGKLASTFFCLPCLNVIGSILKGNGRWGARREVTRNKINSVSSPPRKIKLCSHFCLQLIWILPLN